MVVMNCKFLLLILFKIVLARISIQIGVDKNNNVTISYTGIEVEDIQDADVKLFKIDSANLLDAVEKFYGQRPRNVYLKSPTPWGDLYKSYKWEPITRVLSIKSARVKGISKQPVVVLSQDFENLSENTVKVNTGITHTVENTLTTSWSRNKEMTVGQEISYDVNVIFAKVAGTTSFSYSTNWGNSEEKSDTVTIGTNTGMETELKPGQSVTSVLSANAGYLEIEVIYKAYLRGHVAVNFKKALKGHHFYGPRIQHVLRSANINNEITVKENIRFGFHVDASLKVYDKAIGEAGKPSISLWKE